MYETHAEGAISTAVIWRTNPEEKKRKVLPIRERERENRPLKRHNTKVSDCKLVIFDQSCLLQMALLLLGKTYWMAADATAVSGIITRRGEEMDQVRALFFFYFSSYSISSTVSFSLRSCALASLCREKVNARNTNTRHQLCCADMLAFGLLSSYQIATL
jgi:hypothetical protein